MEIGRVGDLCVFFNDTATTEIYTLSLHDALPIWTDRRQPLGLLLDRCDDLRVAVADRDVDELRREVEVAVSVVRSEEHTSELQSRQYLVCRLLLAKKNSDT